MPNSAPLPLATMIAVGVANPNAHGQAITRTATACIMARVKPLISEPVVTGMNIQTRKVIKAMAMTIGTKMDDTLSARCWTGALLPCASSTNLMIWDKAVSLPIRDASKRKKPTLLSVAPNTVLPGCFSTGRDSPVSMDSSTVDFPSTTTPSTGIFDPGLTRTISPISTSSTASSTS